MEWCWGRAAAVSRVWADMEDAKLLDYVTQHKTVNYFYLLCWFSAVPPLQYNPVKTSDASSTWSGCRKIGGCRCSIKCYRVGYIHVQYSMLRHWGATQNLKRLLINTHSRLRFVLFFVLLTVNIRLYLVTWAVLQRVRRVSSHKDPPAGRFLLRAQLH